MKKTFVLAILGISIYGCSPPTYFCSEDQKIISDLSQAYVLSVVVTKEGSSLKIVEEKDVEVWKLSEIAANQNIPVEDFAFGCENKMFCSVECAEKAKARKDKENEQKRKVHSDLDRQDALFRDSLSKGLIKY